MERLILRPQVFHVDKQLRCFHIVSAHRRVHSSRPRQASVASPPLITPLEPAQAVPTTLPACKNESPSSMLPISAVLRSYMIMGLSSSPVLLKSSIALLRHMTRSKGFVLNPERNPLLRWLLMRTFYAQFCAGENKAEVQRSIEGIKSVGFSGVILEFALEVLSAGKADAQQTAQEVEKWRKGMLETVDMATAGDFVALKWTGLGAEALQLLNANKAPSPAMQAAIDEVCNLAAKKNVAVLPGAELSHTNVGLEQWCIDLQRRYNKPGRPVVMYTTYQAYLKTTPERLARDLDTASREGFALGAKLVRGAYLALEPAGVACESKAATDKQYDALMSGLLLRIYNNVLTPAASSSKFPEVAVVLATHNTPSVQQAMAIRNKQSSAERVECAYAQLQGMADEISCELVHTNKQAATANTDTDRPRTFKAATWGTMTECLQFLLRRAAENQDAAGRTVETRRAMGQEIGRRLRTAVGLRS